MEPVFPENMKRCFHFLLQQLRFWLFLFSTVSRQSLFSQVFLKAGLSPVTYRKFKPTVLVFICLDNNIPTSGLKEYMFIALLL